jgi:hypothetical protein
VAGTITKKQLVSFNNKHAKARSFKSRSQRFLISYFRVREHSLFGLRCRTLVVVLNSNEYIFTKMVNAERHGMFNQNRNYIRQHNKRINSLAALAGKITRAHFATLKSCTHKLALYAGCYAINSCEM